VFHVSGVQTCARPILLAGHRDRIGIAPHADAVAPAARLAPPRNIRVPPLLPAAPVHGYTSCRVGTTIVLPSTRASYAPKRIPHSTSLATSAAPPIFDDDTVGSRHGPSPATVMYSVLSPWSHSTWHCRVVDRSSWASRPPPMWIPLRPSRTSMRARYLPPCG